VDLELRAADADRDRAAAVLSGALATGRLTSAEHAERLDAVYAAKTMGDLAPLTRDLPAEGGAGRLRPQRPRRRPVLQGGHPPRPLRPPRVALDAAVIT
jgi:hypothetical protein